MNEPRIPVTRQDPIRHEFCNLDLSIRSGGDGRTIMGIVVPYEQAARVSDGGRPYLESFRMGAFARDLKERGFAKVKLLSQHQAGRNPLGRATFLEERSEGLYGEFAVSKTAAGDEALELVNDRALDSFSIGFVPVDHVQEGRVTVRTSAIIKEASLVTFPSYEGALVGGTRMHPDDLLELAGMVRESIDLRSIVPTGTVEQGTSEEAAPSADAQPDGHAARDSAWQILQANILIHRSPKQ